MTVDKIMTSEVKTCRLEDPLTRAAQIMWDNDCGAVPVVDGSKVIGMITDRDICMAAWTQDAPLSQILVSRACSEEPLSCSPRDPVSKAEETMRAFKVRRLPVVESDHIVGIVSLGDIARAMTDGRSRKSPGDAITPDEVAQTLAAVSQPGQEMPRARA